MAMRSFQQSMTASSVLAPRLRELIRLRIAFHNRCRSCMATRSGAAMADGMTDGAVCSLERPEESEDLTAAEKVALRYADFLATDHLAVGDREFEELRQHFDDGEVVELCALVAFCVGFGRVAATWDLIDELPDQYRGDDAAPWLDGATIR
ncbi:carboxymuconolactone decarboxylase family protein [Nocardioides sp. AE5]|uniref:carboxymuconolactone decarboxylase family protein n=1 Tax=Nocardioides sp. AE5 TaxID=2962573 RepID=UPI002881E46C|nr:carboxymuconolactone decarboxylase family protein [Nocardioides sp. AE5]MDT0202679.1 carboxymuconolactone decarboxylase family protein [Nocardioides sp. AE5]